MVQLTILSTITASIALVAAVPLSKTAYINSTSNTTVTTASTSKRATSTSNGILANSSPAYLPSFPFNGVTPLNPVPTGAITKSSSFEADDYPEVWTQPDVSHPEVQAAIKSISWNHVPKWKPRTEDMEYDEDKDEACWWTNTQCTTPKATYLPDDVKFCPNVGDFGLVNITHKVAYNPTNHVLFFFLHRLMMMVHCLLLVMMTHGLSLVSMISLLLKIKQLPCFVS